MALVYDRVNKFGGAERVLLSLHTLFPKAPLYTSVYNQKTAPWAKVFKVKTSFLQKIPLARRFHEYFAILMPAAFESFDFSQYDLVISITSEAAKGIRTSGKTIHLCYCLTPTRYLWSGYDKYFENPLLRIISYPMVWYLRRWDKKAAKRPDIMVAISKEVQKRIKRYYKRDVQVIYPPVQIPHAKFQVLSKRSKYPIQNFQYFLVVSRLVPYKRIDLAIKAFNELQLPLKIIGTGSEFFKLKQMSGPTIEFLGNLTDEQLLGYYKKCVALIFPGFEDFGLVIVEVQRFGKPVIAYRGGGAVETMMHGKTGLLFYPQTKKALVDAVKRLKKKKFNPKISKQNAMRFNETTFIKNLKRIIQNI